MSHPTAAPRLFVSHDRALHRLVAVEFGRVVEDQAPDRWRSMGDHDVAVLVEAPGGRAVGFVIDQFHTFDPDAPEVATIWAGPRFDAPALGLTAVTVGEIAIAARRHFGGRNSVDRTLAAMATSCSGAEAHARWTHCLEAGDATAHHELGRTLLDLDRPAEAYAHIRHYATVAPHGAWNWNLLGRKRRAGPNRARGGHLRARWPGEVAARIRSLGVRTISPPGRAS